MSMTTKPVIAFLGIGLMGKPMARNLLGAGFDVRAWNRTMAKAEVLADDGALICQTAAQAVQGADVIITMVSDGAAFDQLLFGDDLVRHIKPGAVVIDMSSTKASEAKAYAGQLAEASVGHLDAPVSGGTKGAQAGSLAIMVGGDKAVFDRLEAVFVPMGRATYVGPAGAGQLAKLANQAIVGVTIGVVAEAMLFLEKGGADPAAVREALKGGFADSTILQQHGARMTTGDFIPGGTARTQRKDMTNILEEAEALGLDLPMSRDVLARYHKLIEALEGGELDHSALYLELLDYNKLKAN